MAILPSEQWWILHRQSVERPRFCLSNAGSSIRRPVRAPAAAERCGYDERPPSGTFPCHFSTELSMATETAPEAAAATTRAKFSCRRAERIAALVPAWDSLLPRDVAHLRSGMLAAAEASGIVEKPTYYLLETAAGHPAAAATAYDLPTDPVAGAPAAVRGLVARIRQRAPGFLSGSMRVCGSPISNSASGIYLAEDLSDDDRCTATDQLVEAVLADGGVDQSLYFRDFTRPQVEGHARRLAAHGFFEVAPPPGMRLQSPGSNMDEYLTALKKRYRQRVRKDLKTSDKFLDFELLDDFTDLAPKACALYENVLAKADYVLETLNVEFFAAISRFDQAKLLVAREKATGELAGINLLLFGDQVMQNLFIGFDYETTQQYGTYFSLVIHSLRLALEHGCTTIDLGQDSYEFKARLGARPTPLTSYMKHRMWPVHFLLRASRGQMFPEKEGVVHDVFQAPRGEA